MATASPSPNAPGLRERKNARTRAAITRAALELALESGFEHATVAKIAERADVAPGPSTTGSPPRRTSSSRRWTSPSTGSPRSSPRGDGDTLDRVRRWLDGERHAHTEPDEITRLRHRLLLTDPQLRAGQRARQQAAEDLIATAIADETDSPPTPSPLEPSPPRSSRLSSRHAERFAEQRERHDEDFAGTRDMLRAALDALAPQSLLLALPTGATPRRRIAGSPAPRALTCRRCDRQLRGDARAKAMTGGAARVRAATLWFCPAAAVSEGTVALRDRRCL